MTNQQVSYQIFGSGDSLDLDVCFFVKSISASIEENKRVLFELSALIDLPTEKPINANLAVVKDGILIDCFKGLKDELNNALLETYALHKQSFPLMISQRLERDVLGKLERSSRVIVSYFSRTKHRLEVKKALRGTFADKLDFLEHLSIDENTDFGKNGSREDVFKSIAFQLAQSRALLDGEELFTKQSLGQKYPQLLSFLERKNEEATVIEKFKNEWVAKAKANGNNEQTTRHSE